MPLIENAKKTCVPGEVGVFVFSAPIEDVFPRFLSPPFIIIIIISFLIYLSFYLRGIERRRGPVKCRRERGCDGYRASEAFTK